MAQLVEQRIRNAQVIGSSPITSSMASLREAFIVLTTRFRGTRSKTVILSAVGFLFYAVSGRFCILKLRKTETEKSENYN